MLGLLDGGMKSSGESSIIDLRTVQALSLDPVTYSVKDSKPQGGTSV